MLLYHGTNSLYLENILEAGILPRRYTQAKGNWPEGLESHENRVYLTDAYAPYFAESSLGKKSDEPVVIVIDSDKAGKLIADEDAIEQVERAQNKLGTTFPPEFLTKRTQMFRNLAEHFQDDGRFTYKDSLEALGNCAHIGPVPPEAIVGYIHLRRGNSWSIWDPTITVMNYLLMKEFYRYATELLWKKASDVKLQPHQIFMHPIDQLTEAIENLIIERKSLIKL